MELPGASVSKQALMKNLSYEIELNLHEHEPVRETHIHMNGLFLEQKNLADQLYVFKTTANERYYIPW